MKARVHFIRVNRDPPGNERDLVESISDAGLSITSNPHSHIKFVPVSIVHSGFHNADIAEAKRAFDLRTRRRRSHSAVDNATRDAHAGGDSTLQLSRGEKPPQEKPTNRS